MLVYIDYKMKIVFLGTSSMQPTRERNLTSIYVNYDKEHLLFDCGEGTQRQMKYANLKPTSITRIFITHFHADHVLGLAGLMRNLGANDYNKTLHIFGPSGLEKFFDNMMNSAYYTPNVKVKLIEIKDNMKITFEKFIVKVFKLEHTVPSFGYRIEEKDKRKINLEYTSKFGLTQHPLLGDLQNGKDIIWEGKKITVARATKLVKGKVLSIILDTGYCNKAIEAAKNADLLISESTFLNEHEDKAKEFKHLTAKQAAIIAKKAKAKKLVLTHFSQRYKDVNLAKKEAEVIFKNVEVANDLSVMNL